MSCRNAVRRYGDGSENVIHDRGRVRRSGAAGVERDFCLLNAVIKQA